MVRDQDSPARRAEVAAIDADEARDDEQPRHDAPKRADDRLRAFGPPQKKHDRRDEERARAKERVFSVRDSFGGWDPRRQRPELWDLYNGGKLPGENIRVFPISNWTEADIWEYIGARGIELPPIYFAHDREVFERGGMWLTAGEWGGPREGEELVTRQVRFRTVGDMSCTGAVLSDAADVEAVIAEIATSTLTERGATRADDRLSESAMEDRKKEGYF